MLGYPPTKFTHVNLDNLTKLDTPITNTKDFIDFLNSAANILNNLFVSTETPELENVRTEMTSNIYQTIYLLSL